MAKTEIEINSDHANLALAAYSTFNGSSLDALLPTDFTDSDRSVFIRDWSLVDQYNDASTGLSATVFVDKSGKKFLAIRGTESGYDYTTDAVDIAVLGSPAFQSQYQSLKAKVKQWTSGPVPVLSGNFTVTGHSLGGFLATALASDAETAANVSHAYLFNAPGLRGSGYITALYAVAGPVPSVMLAISRAVAGNAAALSFDPAKFTNIKADVDQGGITGISPVAELGNQVKSAVYVEIENQVTSPLNAIPGNHGMRPLKDSLALLAVFSKLDNSINEGVFKQLFTSSSDHTLGSLEALLDKLANAFGIPGTTVEGDRESFYSRIKLLQEKPEFSALAGQLQIKSTFIQDSILLAEQAQTDYATFWALTNQSSIILSGNTVLVEDMLSKLDPNLHANWVNDQSDTNKKQENGTLNYSQEWCADTAIYLEGLLQANITDSNQGSSPDDDTWLVEDRQHAPGRIITLSPAASATDANGNQQGGTATGNINHLVFGMVSADAITGGIDQDHFYGGDGNDTLAGAAGNDYLEGNAGADNLDGGDDTDTLVGGAGDDSLLGGKGNDLLKGGDGKDTYKWGTDSGIDTIYDSDGKGSLVWNGATLDGGSKVADNVWQSTDKHFKYVITKRLDGQGQSSNTLTVTHYDDKGVQTNEKLVINNYVLDGANSALGLNLPDPITDPAFEIPTSNVVEFAPFDSDPSITNIRGWGHLEGTTGDDAFTIVVTNDGKTVNNQFVGHGGNDFLEGGVKNDQLFSEEVVTREQAGSLTKDQVGNGARGAYLTGVEGDDLLVGGAGNDLEFGGAGFDDIYGGGGDDVIFGDLWNAGMPFGTAKYAGFGSRMEYDVLTEGEDNNPIYSVLNFDVYSNNYQKWDSALIDNRRYYYSNEEVDSTALLQSGQLSDVLAKTGGRDNISGGQGNDYIFAEAGSDSVTGDDGNDVIFGQEGSDTIQGGEGNDNLYGDGYYDKNYPAITKILYVNYQYYLKHTDHYVLGTLIPGDGTFKSDEEYFKDGIRIDRHYATTYTGNDLGGGTYQENTLLADIPQPFKQYSTKEAYVDPRFSGNDEINGGNGDDKIWGNAGNDILRGGADNDVIHGDDEDLVGNWHGMDVIAGGTGTDKLYGDGGDDIINGDEGDDQIFGDNFNTNLDPKYHGNDFVDGGEGNDQIFGGGGQDELYGGKGDDLISGDDAENTLITAAYHGNDYIDGEDGNDTLAGGGKDDQIYGGNGDDILVGDGSWITLPNQGNDYLDGGVGDDYLEGNGGNDVLVGGAGGDAMYGGAGNDTYLLSYSDMNRVTSRADLIVDSEGNNRIVFDESVDLSSLVILDSADGLQLQLSFDDTHQVFIDKNFNSSSQNIEFKGRGTFSLDELTLEYGQSELSKSYDTSGAVVTGSNKSDQLTSSGGNAKFKGGRGNDILRGDGGNNAYYLNIGDGSDTIYDVGNRVVNGIVQKNRVVFGTGITANDLSLNDAGGVIKVQIGGPYLDSLTLGSTPTASASTSVTIDEFQFADGSVLSYQDLLQKENLIVADGVSYSIIGTALKDRIQGSDIAEQIYAQDGDDIIIGGHGDDSLDGGNGSDTYLFNRGDGHDVINFRRNPGADIDTIEFGSGILPTDVILRQQEDRYTVTISGSSDTIEFLVSDVDRLKFNNGTVWSKSDMQSRAIPLPATTGNDNFSLTYKDDVFDALAGDDYINASLGNDVVHGGIGNDQLLGDEGADSLYGDAGNDYLSGGNGNDILVGGTGDDSLLGEVGDDTYLFGRGDGRDIIYNSDDATVRNDVVKLGAGIATTDVTLLKVGNDLQISINGSTDTLTVYNYFTNTRASTIDKITFADNSSWNNTDIYNQVNHPTTGNDDLTGTGGNDVIDALAGDDVIHGAAGNDALLGNTGNDSLFGDDGNDTLDGGAGTDTLTGGLGNDIYKLNFGADQGADVINNDDVGVGRKDVISAVAGIAPSDIKLTRHLYDLIVTVKSTGNTLTVAGHFENDGNNSKKIDQIVFNDGTIWTTANILTMVNTPTTDADELWGTAGNDTISGLAGNDTLYAQAGNDTLDGGDGDDFVYADVGDDTITGGKGTDTLFAGDGKKTFVIKRGDGIDTIRNYDSNNTLNPDKIQFDSSIAQADVLARRNGNSLQLTVKSLTGIGGATDNTVIVDNYFAADNYRVAQIQFLADNSIWDSTIISQKILLGTSGADTIIGTSSNDVIDGAAGDDAIYGDLGNDNIIGGSGGDSLFGGDGDDTLTGGLDDDFLQGGLGNDIYKFGRNQGYDLIFESGGTTDQITLDADVLPTAVKLYRSSSTYDVYDNSSSVDDLILVIDGSQAQIRIQDFFSTDQSSRVEKIVFGNGTVWTTTEINANIVNLAGTQNTLLGTAGNDTFTVDHVKDVINESLNAGTDKVVASVNYVLPNNVENLDLTGLLNINGIGNDLNNVINGNSGRNYLDGGAGTDTLSGGAGDDVYVVDYSFKATDQMSLFSRDIVVENANSGIDTVLAKSYSIQLADNVENLKLLRLLDGEFYREQFTGYVIPREVIGNSLNNTIDESSSNSQIVILDGGIGADTMIGGSGKVIFRVDNVGDVVITTSSPSNQDVVEASISYALGANVGNLVLTGSATINGTGNALNNMLDGSKNAAVNVLSGGLGDDTYILGSGDTLMEVAGQGSDTVFISTPTVTTYLLSSFANVENISLDDVALTSNLTGDINNNVITGNRSDNVLVGGDGNDLIKDGPGNLYDANNNLLLTQYDTDVINGGKGADTLIGNAGADRYVFNLDDGNDVIADTSKDNILQFGAGITRSDLTFSKSANNDLVIQYAANAALNTITVQGYFNLGTTGNLARIEFADATIWDVSAGITPSIVGTSGNDTLNGSSGNDSLSGLAGNDVLNGLAGNDVLNGGAGVDTMVGGLGDDIYVVDVATDVITENANEGTDLVQSSVTYTLANNVENLTLTGVVAINATGNALNNLLIGNSASNILTGGAGNDTLNGGLGNDSLLGGLGDDLYIVDAVGDVVTENASEGTDLIQSSVTYTLGNNVENLSLSGVSAINGTGNALNNILIGNGGVNTLTGGAGNDTLDGGAGNDVLLGGLGDDIYIVDAIGDVITENASEGTDLIQSSVSYTVSNNVENLLLTGVTSINGTGNALNNVLTGNAGNNTLNGGAGIDTLIGGAGDDIYVVDVAGDIVTENANQGIDLVQSGATYTLAVNVENLVLTGTAAINGTGNSLNNVLTGNSAINTLTGAAGNDILDGGAGNDSLIGGAGDDTYVVDAAGDVITELANEGGDLVQSSVTYTLGSNIENLTLTGTTAINGTGNTLNNLLVGNGVANTLSGGAGNDSLDGGAGNDTLLGGAGDDLYIVDSLGDIVTENANEGNDIVQSGVTYTLGANLENLTLTGILAINGTGNSLNNLIRGNTVSNSLDGGAGNDAIEGWSGDDTMTDLSGINLFNGGAGIDTIKGAATTELFIGGLGNDTITTGAGKDLLLFNKGDGTDTVTAATTSEDILSLGGGIKYADLNFVKTGNDLILAAGGADQITLKDWYAGTGNKSVAKLQVVIEGTTDYNATSTSVINNKKVETFDFAGLATKFDQARAANTSLTSWALTNALLTYNLSSSDTAALGGDLAYQYARNGSLSNVSVNPALAILGNASFGTTAQNLATNVATLQDSSPRLG